MVMAMSMMYFASRLFQRSIFYLALKSREYIKSILRSLIQANYGYENTSYVTCYSDRFSTVPLYFSQFSCKKTSQIIYSSA